MSKIHRLRQNKGAALTEYGILVGLIAVLSIISVLSLGNTVQGTFSTVANTLSNRVLTVTDPQTGEIVPGAPTPQPVMNFTITTGNPAGPYIGYCPDRQVSAPSLCGFTSGGSLSPVQPGDPLVVRSLLWSPTNGDVAFMVADDNVAYLEGGQLVCDNGIDIALGGANPLTFSSSNGPRTQLFNSTASNATIPTTLVGQQVTCTFSVLTP